MGLNAGWKIVSRQVEYDYQMIEGSRETANRSLYLEQWSILASDTHATVAVLEFNSHLLRRKL